MKIIPLKVRHSSYGDPEREDIIDAEESHVNSVILRLGIDEKDIVNVEFKYNKKKDTSYGKLYLRVV